MFSILESKLHLGEHPPLSSKGVEQGVEDSMLPS